MRRGGSDRPTFWFATPGYHGQLDQVAGAVRRRGYRAVRLVPDEPPRPARLADRVLYNRTVCIDDLVSGAAGPLPGERTMDLQCDEAMLAGLPEAVLDRFPPDVAARLRARRAWANKYDVAERLRAAGIAVPRQLSARDHSDAEAVAELGLPLTIKVAVSAGGRGVRFASTPAEVAQVVAELDPTREALFFQEYLGNDTVGYCGVVGPDGTALEEIAVRHGEQVSGIRPRRTVIDAPDVVAYGRSVCAALGLRGPVDMDLVVSGDGPLLLDLNPRVWAGMMSMRDLEAHFDAHYLTSVGLPTPAPAGVRPGASVDLFPDDIGLLSSTGQPWRAVLAFVRRAPRIIGTCGARYLAQMVLLRIGWRLAPATAELHVGRDAV